MTGRSRSCGSSRSPGRRGLSGGLRRPGDVPSGVAGWDGVGGGGSRRRSPGSPACRRLQRARADGARIGPWPGPRSPSSRSSSFPLSVPYRVAFIPTRGCGRARSRRGLPHSPSSPAARRSSSAASGRGWRSGWRSCSGRCSRHCGRRNRRSRCSMPGGRSSTRRWCSRSSCSHAATPRRSSLPRRMSRSRGSCSSRSGATSSSRGASTRSRVRNSPSRSAMPTPWGSWRHWGCCCRSHPWQRRNVPVVRAAAAAAIPPLALALELSGSRASWLALAVGAMTVVLLHPAPGLLLRPVVAAAPVAAAAAWAGGVSGLTETVVSPRLSGPFVALLALACAAAAAAAAAALGPRAPRNRGLRREALAVIVAIVVAACGAIAVARVGATEPRTSYYRVAWLEYRAHPLLGSGAGTFGRYWLDLGSPARWGGALDAHSLYLETLAELGPVGLLLLCGFLLAPLRHALARRSAHGVPAAAGATVAFLVHTGLDWDWELPAVVVAALACSAAVALAEPSQADPGPRPAVPRWGRVLALAAALLLGVAAIAGARSTTEPSAAHLTPCRSCPERPPRSQADRTGRRDRRPRSSTSYEISVRLTMTPTALSLCKRAASERLCECFRD